MAPRAKQLSSRALPLCLVRTLTWRRATCRGGNSKRLLALRVVSASASPFPPTLTTQRVATAIANHTLCARAGSVILVSCQPHPPRFMSLNPASIQLRIPYHAMCATEGCRSVSTNQASVFPRSTLPTVCIVRCCPCPRNRQPDHSTQVPPQEQEYLCSERRRNSRGLGGTWLPG